jgi:hypothetical protein
VARFDLAYLCILGDSEIEGRLEEIDAESAGMAIRSTRIVVLHSQTVKRSITLLAGVPILGWVSLG